MGNRCIYPYSMDELMQEAQYYRIHGMHSVY